jgi:threonine dehydratase
MIHREDIEQARNRIESSIRRTPCLRSHVLSQRCSAEVYLKFENFQGTGSFKDRGACNKLEQLPERDRARGVIAASAGNHAQAVAYHAKRLGVQATIVMPTTTSLIKVTSTRGHGARVCLHGANYEEAYQHARTLAQAENLVFVHPFDDDSIMAGQGTLGLEILDQVPDVDAIVCCVGGGGLIAGVATAVKETHPHVLMYGVEPVTMPSMKKALELGETTRVASVKTIADGAAIGKVGDRPFEVAERYLDAITTVDDEEIAEAILLLLEREKTLAEGAGALSVAGLLQGSLAVQNKKVVAVISGGNIDVTLISRVIDRGLARSRRMIRLRVKISDSPGSLAKLLDIVASHGVNVLQITHDRIGSRIYLGQTAVDLTLETRGFEHAAELEKAIVAAGYLVS